LASSKIGIKLYFVILLQAVMCFPRPFQNPIDQHCCYKNQTTDPCIQLHEFSPYPEAPFFNNPHYCRL
jgi:hypothetical protein